MISPVNKIDTSLFSKICIRLGLKPENLMGIDFDFGRSKTREKSKASKIRIIKTTIFLDMI